LLRNEKAPRIEDFSGRPDRGRIFGKTTTGAGFSPEQLKVRVVDFFLSGTGSLV